MKSLIRHKIQLNHLHSLSLRKKGLINIEDSRKQQNIQRLLIRKIQSSTFQRFNPVKIPETDPVALMAYKLRKDVEGCRSKFGNQVGGQNIGYILPVTDYKDAYLGNNGDGHSEEKILNAKGYNIPICRDWDAKSPCMNKNTYRTLPINIFTELFPCNRPQYGFSCNQLLTYILTSDSTVYYTDKLLS